MVELTTGLFRALRQPPPAHPHPAWLAGGALAHGYATTIHKAQGLTVDTTLIYGLGPLTREHGYVALSRGALTERVVSSRKVVDGS